MKQLVLVLAIIAPLSAAAQDSDERGIDLMAEALRLFMRGLFSEMEPAIDDLSEMLQSIDKYHPPEMLPNGDIIIRRKTPMELEDPDGEIEL